MKTVTGFTLLIVLTMTSGCSWLTSGEYFTHSVQIEAEGCDELTITTLGETASSEDSKTAENPL